jgi:hypothetical protein
VADAEQGFALDTDVMSEEQVEVFEDGAGEAVLDGNDSGIDFAVGERGEDVGGEGAGDDVGGGVEFQRRFVTEGSGLTLDSDFHCADRVPCGAIEATRGKGPCALPSGTIAQRVGRVW